LQHHRTPFTSSRFASGFVTDHTDPASRASEATDNGDATVFTMTQFFDDSDDVFRDLLDSPWDRNHESADYPATAAALPATASSPASSRRESRRSADAVPASSYLVTPAAEVVGGGDVAPVTVRRSGAHRIPAPPNALKGRVAVVAVAAGAVVAAGQAAMNHSPAPEQTVSSDVALAAGESPVTAASNVAAVVADRVTTIPTPAGLVPAATSTGAPMVTASNSAAPQILNVASTADLGQFGELLAKGQRYMQERAAAEAEKLRPLFALPAIGTYTSGFGSRWGTLHAGVDIANAIGTPIHAVADGVVIDSGPAAGFGMWVRLQHADGTITVYGHIDSTEVTVGQKVMAGDEIAKMGNRGQSTGPHLHFEVHLAGENKIDPLPWLATRGISLGPERD
jgi:murein DD-endopeptidase MepM/ murein hydrolase activator NlpD